MPIALDYCWDMYVKIVKSGKYRYARIVEGYRDPATGKVRQRVVCNLCKVTEEFDQIVKAMDNFSLKTLGAEARRPGKRTFDSAKGFGDLYVLRGIWHQLGLDKALIDAMEPARVDERRVEALIRTMVMNLLCAPSSKLGVLKWLEEVSADGMPANVEHQQLLRAMDALEAHQDAVEAEVSKLMLPLLDQEMTLALYDLTTVRVHGEKVLDNDIRERGKNKETGGIARQVVYGVVQTADGIPLMHQVHKGNIGEPDTLEGMVEQLAANFPIRRIVAVADRGLLSVKNLDMLSRIRTPDGRGIEFILAVAIRRHRELADKVLKLKFKGDGMAETEHSGYRIAVSHKSRIAREQKNDRCRAISKLEATADKALQKLERQAAGIREKGKPLTHESVFASFKAAVKKAGLSRIVKPKLEDSRFSYTVDEKAQERAEQLDGKLVLLTNVPDMSVEEIFEHYKSRSDIEDGFRTLKSDIGIGPVRHWLPERIQAHGMLCFLALLIHRYIRMILKRKGLHRSTNDALRTLRLLKQVEATVDGVKMKGLTTPSHEQLELFSALELEKPE